MKALNEKEMRAVDGGVTYVTFCGYVFTDKNPLTLGKGLSHKLWCSACIAAKNTYGRYYTFNTRSAKRAAWPGFKW